MAKRSSADQVHSFTAVLERSDNKLWGCHFPVPKKTADSLLSGTDRRGDLYDKRTADISMRYPVLSERETGHLSEQEDP